MKNLVINIPESLEIDNKEISMIIASKLYEQGRLSLGEASKIVGVSKRVFCELLEKYDVSIFNAPYSELTNDIANA